MNIIEQSFLHAIHHLKCDMKSAAYHCGYKLMFTHVLCFASFFLTYLALYHMTHVHILFLLHLYILHSVCFQPVQNCTISHNHMIKKKNSLLSSFTWRCAIFTRARLDIVAAEVLNFCVRDENRCVHFAIITRSDSQSIKTEQHS